MSLDRPDFDAINEGDINELVVAQVAEGIRVDFKRGTYGGSDRDRADLASDVSAFANSYGGHLILGVEEANGVAARIEGIDGIDPDAELLRMEQIIRAGIEPRVSGVRMKTVRLTNGNVVFVIRVPRSWNRPHRVCARGMNRFYIRHSSGNHEPSVEELRVLFGERSSTVAQAAEFRDERIATVGEGSGIRPLVGNGRLYMHMYPSGANSGQTNIDIEQALRASPTFRPLGAEGMTPRFNYYGFINERGGEFNHGYTQVFRNGCLEATLGDLIRERNGARFISGIALERKLIEAVPSYISGLRELGVPPPIVILLTLQGVGGAEYAVGADLFDADPPLPEDTLRLPACILEEFGSNAEHQETVRPALDAIWNAIGYSCDQFFTRDGHWLGRQKSMRPCN